MISLAAAQSRVDRDIHRLSSAIVHVPEAHGLVSASDIRSAVQIPPFISVAMDGFSVLASDTHGASEINPVELDVIETVPAGRVAESVVTSGSAIRIMTGAPLPRGADAVIMVERTQALAEDSTSQERIMVLGEVPPQNHLRMAGSAVAVGEVVVPQGTVLGSSHIGLLSSIGLDQVEVFRRPSVGVLSTGDELVPPPASLAPGQIYDSNRSMLLAMVQAAGCTPVDLGHCSDDESEIEQVYADGAETCDALMSSGGVSMGDFDPVKVVLSRLGDMNWMQVAIKPAKPLSFGVLAGTPVFGLPGNPVSAAVSFELFARPGLLKMMGDPNPFRRLLPAICDDTIGRRVDGKTHFVRVVASYQSDGALHVRSAGGQGSHQLGALAAANALAVLPDGVTIREGGRVNVLLIDTSPFSSSLALA